MLIQLNILWLFVGLALAGDTYTDAQARAILTKAGISAKIENTSLEGVRVNTINGIIKLKKDSKCTIYITDGTEGNVHKPGTKSHANGYKLDIRLDDCVNSYIKKTCIYDGIRSDGAKTYVCSPVVYALESNHWDILFP